jgi:hypothetical protein
MHLILINNLVLSQLNLDAYPSSIIIGGNEIPTIAQENENNHKCAKYKKVVVQIRLKYGPFQYSGCKK